MSQIATPPPTIMRAITGILTRNAVRPAHDPSIQLNQLFTKSPTSRKKVIIIRKMKKYLRNTVIYPIWKHRNIHNVNSGVIRKYSNINSVFNKVFWIVFNVLTIKNIYLIIFCVQPLRLNSPSKCFVF